MKNNLIAPGIFNIIVSLFWIVISIPDNYVTLSIGMLLIVFGVLSIMYSRLDIEELYEKRNIVLTFGVILIPFNIISAILLLVESDKIKAEYNKFLRQQDVQVLNENNQNIKMKKEVSKEVKKLDILLKLGIGMVTVAGIMIATTSWEIMTDLVKMIIIALIGGLLLGLSIFSDKKLKIRGTTITYWLLSMIAFCLSIFMIGNYQLFGEWFSTSGDGASLFVATWFLCASVFSYITFKKFDIQAFLYMACVGVAIALACIVGFLSDRIEICILALTIFVTLINFIPKSENKEIKIVKLFGIITSYVIVGLLILELFNTDYMFLVLISMLVQMVNLVNIALTDKREEITVLSGLSIIALSAATLANIDWNLDKIYVMLINRSIILALTIALSFILIRNKKVRGIIFAIVLPLIMISLMYEINIAIAIYIGCFSLAMIIFGFIKKDYKAIYIEGIIFLIANLVIQLWEFWGVLPIWVYLLVGGLTLIGIVTVKELKKDKM